MGNVPYLTHPQHLNFYPTNVLHLKASFLLINFLCQIREAEKSIFLIAVSLSGGGG